MPSQYRRNNENGSVLLLTLILLFLLTLLGLLAALDANTGVKISDNYETQVQATYAALAGLNHARALMRGIAFDDLLQGPDGSFTNTSAYLAQARTFDFRNPLPLASFYGLDIASPSIPFSPLYDDGVISTGFFGGVNGTVLIPQAGIPLTATNPYGTGTIITSRYFVKVTDNNGEASETSSDPSDNPFVDGDGTVFIRSVGISRTFTETTGMSARLNSVAVFESRFQRLRIFDTGPALSVLGSNVEASFQGACQIIGNDSAGIGTIDTVSSDTDLPDRILLDAASSQTGITGGGLPVPSVQEISGTILSDRGKRLLMDPAYLQDFIRVRVPKYADACFGSNQNWSGGNAPYTGSYDPSLPWNAPGQDPKITVVNGDLQIGDGYAGGGLLVVTGTLSCAGPFTFNGLVLVIGDGSLVVSGSGRGIVGGVIVARLTNQSGNVAFGTPRISIGGGRLSANRVAVKMALGLFPVSQTGFREIAGSDP